MSRPFHAENSRSLFKFLVLIAVLVLMTPLVADADEVLRRRVCHFPDYNKDHSATSNQRRLRQKYDEVLVAECVPRYVFPYLVLTSLIMHIENWDSSKKNLQHKRSIISI